MLARVIDPDCQRDIRLIFHSGGKELYGRNTGDFLRHLLVLSCLVIKVNGKLKQPNSGRSSNGPDLSGMMVWNTPPCKEP